MHHVKLLKNKTIPMHKLKSKQSKHSMLPYPYKNHKTTMQSFKENKTIFMQKNG